MARTKQPAVNWALLRGYVPNETSEPTSPVYAPQEQHNGGWGQPLQPVAHMAVAPTAAAAPAVTPAVVKIDRTDNDTEHDEQDFEQDFEQDYEADPTDYDNQTQTTMDEDTNWDDARCLGIVGKFLINGLTMFQMVHVDNYGRRVYSFEPAEFAGRFASQLRLWESMPMGSSITPM